MYELNPPGKFSRIKFCRLFLSELKSGLLDPHTFILLHEGWLRKRMVGYVNSQNMGNYAFENLHHYFKESFHDFKLFFAAHCLLPHHNTIILPNW